MKGKTWLWKDKKYGLLFQPLWAFSKAPTTGKKYTKKQVKHDDKKESKNYNNNNNNNRFFGGGGLSLKDQSKHRN